MIKVTVSWRNENGDYPPNREVELTLTHEQFAHVCPFISALQEALMDFAAEQQAAEPAAEKE